MKNIDLVNILEEIFYLSKYTSLSGEYLENLVVFELEYFATKLKDNLEKEKEILESRR